MRWWHQVFVVMTALALCLALNVQAQAREQSAADIDQVLAAVRSLEARVAALEGQNRQAKAEVADARAETRALRQQLAARSPATPVRDAAAAAPAIVPGALATVPFNGRQAALGAFAANSPAAGWSGLYAGASFGIGGLHGSTRSRYQSVSTDSSTFQSVDPTTGLVDFQSASTGSSVYDAADTSRNKRNAIALADFYAGYNVDIGNNIVAGVQAEGTLSRGTVKMPGRGSSTSTDTGTNVSSGFGPPVTTTSLSLDSDTYTFTDQLSLEWMVSALARVGWADAQNYVYAVGGWSYGKFSLGGPGMGLHGPTGGFGWERKLTSNWSIRGEYRYTKFLPRTFGEQDVFSSTSTSSETDGTSSTFSFNETSGSTTRLSADIHALRFGIAHYFGAY